MTSPTATDMSHQESAQAPRRRADEAGEVATHGHGESVRQPVPAMVASPRAGAECQVLAVGVDTDDGQLRRQVVRRRAAEQEGLHESGAAGGGPRDRVRPRTTVADRADEPIHRRPRVRRPVPRDVGDGLERVVQVDVVHCLSHPPLSNPRAEAAKSGVPGRH